MKTINKIARFFALVGILSTTISVIGIGTASAVTIRLADSDALVFNYANTTKFVGTGKAVNDKILYKNVGTFSGQVIDALVTTVAISGSIADYDNPGSATSNANNFQLNTVGGKVTLRFQFFAGGSYNGPDTGVIVTLQNVRISSIDLDGSTAAGSYQYSDFSGFQKYSMMDPTNLIAIPVTDASTTKPLTRFQANKTGSRSTVPQDQVLIKYDSMQEFYVNFGNVVAGSTNWFGLVFGAWPSGSTPVEYANGYNTPPTSTSKTILMDSRTATVDTFTVGDFGVYDDVDGNPFNSIIISSLPTAGTGTLQYYSGGSWTSTTVSVGQEISIADIESGKFRLNPNSPSSPNTNFNFYVNDGLDNSSGEYTLTITYVGASNEIIFPQPGDTTTAISFASGSTSTFGTPTLTSNTPGTCSVAGLVITTNATTTGICSITATQAGDGSTVPAANPVTRSFTIYKSGVVRQVITFAAPATKASGSGAFASNATTDAAGLKVTLTSLTPSICTVSGLNITPIAPGTCTIVASQDGTASIPAASPVTRDFTVTGTSAPTESSGGGVFGTKTLGVSALSSTTATFNGLVDANAVSTTYKFCYMKESEPRFANETLTANLSGGSKYFGSSYFKCTSDLGTTSSDGVLVSTNITGLSKQNTYYMQIIATQGGTTLYGLPFKFTTSDSNKGLKLWTNPATSVTASSATLNDTATVESDGSTYKILFCTLNKYEINSLSGDLKNCTKSSTVRDSIKKGETKTDSYSYSYTEPGTYYFQVVASRTSNSKTYYTYGNIRSFSTPVTTPTPVTSDATMLKATSAVLNGSINAPSGSTVLGFCWGTSQTLGASNTCTGTAVVAKESPATSIGSKTYSFSLTGLTTNTRYYYKATAKTGSADTATSTVIKSFILGAPTVRTISATSIAKSGSTWSATLSGYVSPVSGTTSIPSFCINDSSGSLDAATGKLATCTSTLAVTDPSSTATSAITFTAPISGIATGATIYFQAIGTDSTTASLITYGSVMSFKTYDNPVVTTISAESISSTSETLTATVKTTNALATTSKFCVSTSSSASNVKGLLDSCLTNLTFTPASTVTAAGTTLETITATVTGLNPGTTYFYQVLGDHDLGNEYGAIKRFSSGGTLPEAVTTLPTSISATGATLNGTINPKGADTAVYFCYKGVGIGDVDTSTATQITGCTTTALVETKTASTDASSSSFTLTASASPKYYYQIVGVNSFGTTYGDAVPFFVGAPAVSTDGASVVSATQAMVYGTVSTNAQALSGTNVKFCISTASTMDSVTTTALESCDVELLSGSTNSGILSNQYESATTTVALTSGTIYYYQISAETALGKTYGGVRQFSAGAPIAVTNAATSQTYDATSLTTGATLNGSINASGDTDVEAQFCLSASMELDAQTGNLKCDYNIEADPMFISGTTATNISSIIVSGLFTGWTYYYQTHAKGLYEGWGEIVSFTTKARVSFNANTGSGTMSDQISDTQTALTANSFTAPSGYHFVNWNTGAAGDGDAFSDSDVYAFTSDLELYAQWSNTCCQLSFNSNGGSGSMNAQTVTQSVAASIRAASYSKSGCTFGGWSTTSGGAATYANSDSITVTTDTTLYAVWTGCASGGAPGGTVPRKKIEDTKPTEDKKTEQPTEVVPVVPAKKPITPIVINNSGVIKTIASEKKVIVNQIVPIKQEITLEIAPDVKIVQVLINGKKSSATVDDGGKIVLPKGVLVGPKDKVSVVAENQGERQTVPVQVKNDPISIGNVNFNLGSYALTPAAKSILKKVAAVVKDHGFTNVSLTGHTDIQGSAGFDNKALSEQRNKAVSAYLKTLLPKGVTVKLTGAYASDKPLVEDKSVTAFKLNRRVEIVVK